MRSTSFAILIAASLGMAGCAVPAQRANSYPYPPVPAVITEIVPQPPVSQDPLVWQPGHWDWTGTGYAWSTGQWVPLAGHGSSWVDGFWTNASGTWAWFPAHWV